MPFNTTINLTSINDMINLMLQPYTSLLGPVFFLIIVLLIAAVSYIYSKNIMVVSLVLLTIGGTTAYTGSLGMIPYIIIVIGITVPLYKMVKG